MDFLTTVAIETARMLYLAAPFLLLGLAMAGFVHVLLPDEWIARFMGKPGLKGAATAAAIGVPLPVCSCGVVPLAVEMKRKKASDPASMAFLITTPESGVDSILFTYGLMGPVMAIARPIAAFVTAMIGAATAIFRLKEPVQVDESAAASCCSSHDHDHGHDHDHHNHAPEPAPAASCCSHDHGAAKEHDAAAKPGAAHAVRSAFRYGFGELFDDIAFWLVLGLLLGGLLTAVLPGDLAALGLGFGLFPMVVMLVFGIPLYMCASASTPVAAALMMKGLSPGAALVFLLAGPATNAAALVVLARTFGRRFIQIYLFAVAAGAMVSGLLLDAVVAFFGWKLVMPMAHAHEHGPTPFGLAASALLVLLLILSTRRGAMVSGWRELVSNFRPRAAATEGHGHVH